MGLVAKQTNDARELAPAGNYMAVIVGVFNIGTQEGGKFGPQHKVIIQFELHRKKGVCRDSKGRVLLMSKFYNFSFGEKANLRADVERILGRKFTEKEAKEGYDLTELIDVQCRVVVVHNEDDGKTYDNIDSVSTPDEEDPEIKPESDGLTYEDLSQPPGDGIPEWVTKLVAKSKEWSKGAPKAGGKARPAPRPSDDDDDDDAAEDEEEEAPAPKAKRTARATSKAKDDTPF